MKRLFVLGVIWAAAPAAAWAEEGQFTRMVKPDDQAAAGLNRLSPAELAKLNQLVEDYKSGALGGAQTPKKTGGLLSKVKILATPGAPIEYQPMESRIVGSLRGWDPRTIFVLENGQCWKVATDDHYYNGPIVVNPKVVIRHVSTFGGFKISIEGVGEVRVRLVGEVAPKTAPSP